MIAGIPTRYWAFLLLSIALLIWAEANAPREIDWSDSYSRDATIPYGAVVLYETLSELFPGVPVRVNEQPLYEALGESLIAQRANLIFINNQFNIDRLETGYLLDHAYTGGHVLIAADLFQGPLADTLQVGARPFRSRFDIDSTSSINFNNEQLRGEQAYHYRDFSADGHFTTFDTSASIVLGHNNFAETNFIHIPYGRGAFFLSAVPHAFTNYNLLHAHNREYVFKALSYLPLRETIWDEYYKLGRQQVNTPLRYILRQPQLRSAYFLMLAGILLFVVFQGRRRQRIIPLISPLANTTVEFIRTVGRLYFLNGDHKNMAEKKITHFLEHLRSHYYVKTDVFDDALYEQIAARGGFNPDEVKHFFQYLTAIRKREQINESELLRLNKLIEQFYMRIGR